MLAKPDLPGHLAFEWTAFQRLSRDRPVGFSIGPIPWASIDRYAARYGPHDADAFERFERLIAAMDAVVMRRAAEKAAEDASKRKP